MFVDIHTHNINTDNQLVIKIVNLDFKLSNILKDGNVPVLFSVGIHPWDVNKDIDFTDFTDFLIKNNVVAIGESGLDKTHKESFEKQHGIFLKMIDFSENFYKPLIIHAVKTYSDIISIRKETKAKMPWIIHGFQGSVESAQQMIRHGMFLSFGEMLYRNENQAVKVLNAIPVERLFFETDVSERNIIDVYEKAATLMNCEVQFLEEKIFENFKQIFGDGKMEEQDTYLSR